MADGTRVNLNTSAGNVIATDQVTDGGVADGHHAQRVKVGFGDDNDYSDVHPTNALPVGIIGAVSGESARVTNGGLDVNIQDQNTLPFDVHFSETLTAGSTLSVDAVIDEWDITATAGHTVNAGDFLVIFDTVANRIYVGQALTAGATAITLDTPLNFSFSAANTVIRTASRELNIDGSVTRRTFQVGPPVDQQVDITRIMFQMTTTNETPLPDFGDIANGLTRGVVARVVNGINTNLFNVKTNGELVNLMFDVDLFDVTKQGVKGLGGRLTYAGQSKHGVTIRLDQDETLEVIIQDDLSTLLSFRMIASGHVVE